MLGEAFLTKRRISKKRGICRLAGPAWWAFHFKGIIPLQFFFFFASPPAALQTNPPLVLLANYAGESYVLLHPHL